LKRERGGDSGLASPGFFQRAGKGGKCAEATLGMGETIHKGTGGERRTLHEFN
jgi:hypothetical protein